MSSVNSPFELYHTVGSLEVVIYLMCYDNEKRHFFLNMLYSLIYLIGTVYKKLLSQKHEASLL